MEQTTSPTAWYNPKIHVERLCRWHLHMQSTFGNTTLIVLFLVYFAQGLRNFITLAITLFYKDILELPPDATQFLKSLIWIAWYIKPIFGLLSDNIPIFGYHRKSYLFLSGIMGIVAYIGMLFIETELESVILLMISEVGQCIADIIADAIMVEASRKDLEVGSGRLQSYCWFSFALGGLIGGTLGGMALDYMSPQHVLACLVVCPMILLVVSICIKENNDKTHLSWATILEKLRKVGKAFTDSAILKALLVIFIARSCSPSFSELMSYFMRDELKFSATFMSFLTTLSYFMLALGSILYGKFIVNWEFSSALGVGQILLTFLGGVDILLVTKSYKNIGASPYYFVLGGDAFGSVIEYTFRKLPMLVLGGQLCPLGIEATLFSLFASASNFGVSVASTEGAFIMKMTGINSSSNKNIWILFAIAALSHLLLFPFLRLLPKKGKADEQNDLKEPLI
ncbi:unnamed protein product [Blepharisma stoltei]|uniref:Uncharacterized protein n=1 Tax=Blepharisma stoltei TaxID=1481888 RepID=A0AAU9IFK8_9CILI|nr:unnamed protein product [Blepharisma stoltei]